MAVCAVVLVLIGVVGLSAGAQLFSRDELIEDARQLARLIEDSHPDPFLRCGGRVVFYRQVNRLLNAIPEAGMTKDDFIRLIRPLVAMVGDAHTMVVSTYDLNGYYPGGVPLRFAVVEESLYVAGALSQADEVYLGCVLVSVEGVPVGELMTRLRAQAGLENDYHVLYVLTEQSLWWGPYLADLLPEWADHTSIRVQLRSVGGDTSEVVFKLPRYAGYYRTAPTAVRLPGVNTAGFYAGLSTLPSAGAKPIGWIRIDHQTGFREAVEENTNAGALETTEAERAQIPSATEEFRDLVVEMAAAGTETLIIDLRGDVGGTDLLADILVYFLYGIEGLRTYRGDPYIHGGASVMRYSALHFSVNTNRSIDEVNEDIDGVPLEVGDYDFSNDFTGRLDVLLEIIRQMDVKAYLADGYKHTPTFYSEFETGAYAAYYTPRNILVLVSPKTFSAGSTTMKAVSLNGATLVGTPSGQSIRGFGNATLWTLDHTGVQGLIARSYFDPYPNDPERSEVWPIDVPLTHEYLAATGFDPNAEVLLALDWLASQSEAE